MSRSITGCVALHLFLALTVPSATHAQTVDPQSIVDANYPIARLQPEEAVDRRSCYEVMRSAPGGAPLRIAAGYTDTVGAVLRLLDRDTTGDYRVTWESSSNLMLAGLQCDITLVDIDGDGSNDVFLELANGRGTQGWLFRSVQNGLDNITPVRGLYKVALSMLSNPGIVDLYHDGSVQVTAAGGARELDGGRVTQLPSIYKFSGSGMVLDSSALLIADFVVSDPVFLRTATFNQQVDGAGPYRLRITNGVRGGQWRVTSIAIRINGTQLQGTASFDEKTEFLDIPVPMQLSDENQIEVVVNGAPDALATVVIRSPTQ
jgi:hypothetical protein